jgi:primosomal protein N' (replication factor Y)
MYQEQMLERRSFAYPPFTRMVIIYLKHRHADIVDALARDAAVRLRTHFGSRVLGPDEPPIARVQSLFIRRIILKLETQLPLSQVRKHLIAVRTELLAEHAYSSAQIFFDVDPL